MKNFVFAVVAVFAITTLIGCGKKKEEQINMELNGVATENVVSVTDAADVPVVVDNASMVPQETATDTAASEPVPGTPTSKQIQQALKNAGLYTGKVDGDIGPKTKKSIEAFQSQNGLKADGKVGAKTWGVLSAYLNKPAEVSNPSAEQQNVGQ